jgi:hypothetical protein
MKKENLIAQLEAAKALTSVVSIDNVIALIQQLEAEQKEVKVLGITEDLASILTDKITRALEMNSDEFADRGSAQFEIGWNNQLELTEVDIDVYEIMRHVEAVLEEFVIEEEDPEPDTRLTGKVAEEGALPDWNTLAEEGVLRDEE